LKNKYPKRRNPKQIKKVIERIREDLKLKKKDEEIWISLGLSRPQYYRYKIKATKSSIINKPKDNTPNITKALKMIRKDLNPIQFCDLYLPAKLLIGQRIVIKAFYSIPFDDFEKKIIKDWKDKGWTTWEPKQRYKELVVVCGMKGSKTTLASFIVQIEEYELFKIGDIPKHYGFTPGEETWILNVATDKTQAKDTIFAKTKASILRSSYFKRRDPYQLGNSFLFQDTNVRIISGHSNSASLVGKTCKLVLLDELDRFKGTGGKYSADAVYDALDSSTDPFDEEGHIVSISSLVKEKGKVSELYLKSRNISNMLGFWLPEWEMRREKYKMYWDSGREYYFFYQNLKIPIEHKAKFDKNPGGFLRDKGSVIGYTKGKYYRMPWKIKECFEQAHNEGYKNPETSRGQFIDDFKQTDGHRYYMHGDPSLNHDSYGIALGHKDGDNIIIDLMHRIFPQGSNAEIDDDEVKKYMDDILLCFPGVELITYDTWAAQSVRQSLQKKGKIVENLYIKKPQHDLLKEITYSKKLKCYRHEKLEEEMRSLEQDGDSIDHPDEEGASKDCADAVAGVVWHCIHKDSGPEAAGAVRSESEEEEEGRLQIGFKTLTTRGRKRIWER